MSSLLFIAYPISAQHGSSTTVTNTTVFHLSTKLADRKTHDTIEESIMLPRDPELGYGCSGDEQATILTQTVTYGGTAHKYCIFY